MEVKGFPCQWKQCVQRQVAFSKLNQRKWKYPVCNVIKKKSSKLWTWLFNRERHNNLLVRSNETKKNWSPLQRFKHQTLRFHTLILCVCEKQLSEKKTWWSTNNPQATNRLYVYWLTFKMSWYHNLTTIFLLQQVFLGRCSSQLPDTLPLGYTEYSIAINYSVGLLHN